MTVHYVFVLRLGSLAWLGSQRPARRLIPQPRRKCLGEVFKLLGKERNGKAALLLEQLLGS